MDEITRDEWKMIIIVTIVCWGFAFGLAFSVILGLW